MDATCAEAYAEDFIPIFLILVAKVIGTVRIEFYTTANRVTHVGHHQSYRAEEMQECLLAGVNFLR